MSLQELTTSNATQRRLYYFLITRRVVWFHKRLPLPDAPLPAAAACKHRPPFYCGPRVRCGCDVGTWLSESSTINTLLFIHGGVTSSLSRTTRDLSKDSSAFAIMPLNIVHYVYPTLQLCALVFDITSYKIIRIGSDKTPRWNMLHISLSVYSKSPSVNELV